MTGDGGPAFPAMDTSLDSYKGMSLRDWFAGQALSGVAGNVVFAEKRATWVAEIYRVADAMLKAREKAGA